MKKILLCGLKYDSNFGDPIICECCYSLIKQILAENEKKDKYELDEIDLSGRKSFTETYKIDKNAIYYAKRVIGKFLEEFRSIARILKNKKIFNWLDMKQWKFTKEYMIMKKYYFDKVKKSDIIIFTGGGMLKYKYQNCYNYIDQITKIAEENNIPVGLNAVGVEGYDEENIKCRILKKALNRKCIKMVTTRDDINKLKKYISNPEIVMQKVSDSATYANIVYEIEKNYNSEIIGLGMSRGDLFLDNDIKYTEKELMILWKNIIDDLEKQNIKWKIYTNGLQADNEFVFKFLKFYDYNEEKIILPSTPKELIEIIASFKGIIATRLHSCIVAYSLKIPAIGLVWNQKLKMFGESIKYPQRFLDVKNFESNKIINALRDAIIEEYKNIRTRRV